MPVGGKLTGVAVKLPFEGFEIVGVVVETALHAGSGDGGPAAEQVPGDGNPLFDDVLIDAHASIALDLLAQVKFADVKFPGDVV